MAPKVLFWDLETTGLDDDCAATVGVVGDEAGECQVFHSGYGCEMTVSTALEMLTALEAADTVVTFNGAGFDFRVLARVTGDTRRVAACCVGVGGVVVGALLIEYEERDTGAEGHGAHGPEDVGEQGLLANNHHRPYALAVSPRDYARLVQQREGQFAPELDAIQRLCDDGVYTSPAIPDGKAVLVSTGDQNFDIAVTEDLRMVQLDEQDQDLVFRVYECLVLRIKRPQSICTIE